MDGAEDESAGGAVAQQFVEEEGRNLRAMRFVGKGGLGREDVAFEPFEQLFAMRGDAVGLWEMNMRVDEAGHDQPAGMIDDLGASEARGEFVPCAEGGDMAVLDREQPVQVVQDRRRAGRGRIVGNAQQFGAVNGQRHARIRPTSAPPIGGISIRRDEQGDMIMAGRIGHPEIDHDDIEEGRIGQGDAGPAEIIRHREFEAIAGGRELVLAEQAGAAAVLVGLAGEDQPALAEQADDEPRRRTAVHRIEHMGGEPAHSAAARIGGQSETNSTSA